MTRDQLEFAISQYLDGTLPPQERTALEQEVAADPAARELFNEHLKLNELIKVPIQTPTVQWDRLAQQISDAVAAQANAGEESLGGAVPDDVELAIMQYADGELPEEERAAVEKRLAENPAARQILSQHRALGTALKHAWPVPHIDHDRFAQHLSETVVEEAAPSSYSMKAWMRYGAAVAIAACVLIATALAIKFGTTHAGKPDEIAKVQPQKPADGPSSVLIVRLMPEPPSAAPIVRIGPSDDGMSLPGDAVVASSNKSQLAVFADTVPVSADNGLFSQ